MEYSIPVVCLLGVGIVFFGLICLVFVIWVIGKLFREKPAASVPVDAEVRPDPEGEDTTLKVVIAAALAEFLRVEYQDIHIVSVTRQEEEL